jgi:hypothetical protein
MLPVSIHQLKFNLRSTGTTLRITLRITLAQDSDRNLDFEVIPSSQNSFFFYQKCFWRVLVGRLYGTVHEYGSLLTMPRASSLIVFDLKNSSHGHVVLTTCQSQHETLV